MKRIERITADRKKRRAALLRSVCIRPIRPKGVPFSSVFDMDQKHKNRFETVIVEIGFPGLF